jgi:glycosyltransferase involved in cell wall biosynthesis
MGTVKFMIRKKLGLVFLYDEQWIGGTYYLLNLVNALNSLEDSDKPEIIVFSDNESFERLESETGYPHLIFESFSKSEYSNGEKLLNKLSVKILGKKLVTKRYKNKLDALFIMQRSEYLESIPSDRRIYWIPDFQDKRFPQFFSDERLGNTHQRNLWIHAHAKKLILSSEAVKKDWEHFYPDFEGKSTVVHFAVTHPEYDSLDIIKLREKYNLPDEYFFSPNQFWAHKNHIVVLEAAKILKERGDPVIVAFSGKENDNRNPGYTESLKDYVAQHKLEDVVRFLGFLDRREQLKLMKHAKAIIQPSLFEGWSTVIEDAMAMNQPVIASDIEVNAEQLGDKGIFFRKNNPENLAKVLMSIKSSETVSYAYGAKRLNFAQSILKIIQQ